MQYVNLGCGARFHPDWVNIDMESTGPGVIAHDLSRGIPLKDSSSDVVYHSAILEHIRRSDASSFTRECYRVLKPGGFYRVATPDLEQICRLYLANLESAMAGDANGARNHEWMLLEMYDQTVRERSGGDMADFLAQKPIPNEEFVFERIGEEGRRIADSLSAESESWLPRLKRTPPSRLAKRLIGLISANAPKLLLRPSDKRALKIGRFRLSGEVHQWMYDRWSLSQLLLEAGFEAPTQRSASDSLIPDWASFNLDTDSDGKINKPDLLYMEAVKPR